jgi:hypothetical protein
MNYPLTGYFESMFWTINAHGEIFFESMFWTIMHIEKFSCVFGEHLIYMNFTHNKAPNVCLEAYDKVCLVHSIIRMGDISYAYNFSPSRVAALPKMGIWSLLSFGLF